MGGKQKCGWDPTRGSSDKSHRQRKVTLALELPQSRLTFTDPRYVCSTGWPGLDHRPGLFSDIVVGLVDSDDGLVRPQQLAESTDSTGLCDPPGLSSDAGHVVLLQGYGFGSPDICYEAGEELGSDHRCSH